MNLVIVESPTKSKTIEKFLSKEYLVRSSYGHVRDLPKSKIGIDIENNFEPQYVVPIKSRKVVNELKKISSKAEKIILATDEDREGEAIAWHLVQALGLDKIKNQKSNLKNVERIVFHEITKTAIEKALKNPREINQNLVDAQQARRVLDRLVGYKLSPFLWKKIARGLSAGRVQSVALRLIVDREEEIKNFKPEEYWTIEALFKKNGFEEEIESELQKINGKTLQKMEIKNENDARKIIDDLEKSVFEVNKVERKETVKNPLPPFTTSTLQQAAVQRLGFSSKKTMFLAQSLYENGLITYMRTDSVNISKEALLTAHDWILKNLGENYALKEPRKFKNKSKLAQEAHEAIRPTEPEKEPGKAKLEKDHARLYELIWRRFIASQLPSAVFDATRVEIEASGKKNSYTFASSGAIVKFDGFLKLWPMKFEEKELPPLSPKDKVDLKELKPEQHFTEPPPRYNEASLIKTLEKYGIGRPSTYAPIISVIQERNYAEKIQGKFYPTEMGALVNKVLKEHFPEIVDIEFTAKMEEELDEIAQGKETWQKIIKEFYDPFSSHLEKKYEEVNKKELINEETDVKCEKCGKPMLKKFGRFGQFLACSGYPECKNTKTLKEPPKAIGLKCPNCGEGEVIERKVKKGRARGKSFWGCSRYPACRYASWKNPKEDNAGEARS